MANTNAPSATVAGSATTLRLVWPQWQGAGTESVRTLFSDVPFEEARRGYAVGAAVLDAVLLPTHGGPTEVVQVEMGDLGLDRQDGIEAKEIVLAQLARALEAIGRHSPERILTLGGDCSVSVAPFSWLASRYADLAVLWIDSHPDVGTPASQYPGYHAMAVAVLTGHGDPDLLRLLPATVDPSRVALVGLHSWDEDDFANVAGWGISSCGPEDLRLTSQPLLDWLEASGCSRVAIHFDVDVVDSGEIVLGLGAEPGGLTGDEARRLVADASAAADVVGLTIAEYIPRQVIRLQRMLRGFPLI